jgi:hypothetical protein
MMARAAPAVVAALVAVALLPVAYAGCEYHTNCAACVADTTCGWCGNDPYHAGGYGFTLQGDHTEGNPFSPDAYMVGGIGKVKLQGVSASGGGADPAPNTVILGQNTVFTKQFRGYSSYNSVGIKGKNPYKLVVVVNGVSYAHAVYRVWSDTMLEVEQHLVDFTSYIPFTLGTPRGTGGLSYGPADKELVLPNSETKEQLTIVCTAGNDLPTSPTPSAGCKFTKELKPGYLVVLDKVTPPLVRVVTSIKSDTEFTVDADFGQENYTVTDTLTHSGDVLADPDDWTFVACPPRVGKRAVGLGSIETHTDQETDFKDSDSIPINSGVIQRMSGAGTLKRHRIIGRGTRFETQFGKEAHWSKAVSGGYFGHGPWVQVQINGDWETQVVVTLGTSGTYAEYIMVLENSFSEPLLKSTHFHWYTMLTKGYGRIRTYGKRVVSNAWSNTEFSTMAGEGTTEGFYGNTRFLTQLRTGFTITACGQTRMVNSIQSDVELTVDRPFTLGNREFIPAPGSMATASSLYVRGLTRLMPLWPRGVTIQIIVTKVTGLPKYKYHVWWKTFKHTDDGDNNSADDQCTTADIDNDVDCGIEMKWATWKQLEDKELQKTFGVYIKWAQCDMGAGESGGNCQTPVFAKFDQWKLHVSDIENCEYWISTEGERFITDDNANPPVCYNYGKCLPITSDATTVAEAQKRPQLTAPGLVSYDLANYQLTSVQDPYDSNRNAKFTSDVTPGDIIRILVDGTGDATKWKDIRVTRIVSDTELLSDYEHPISPTTSPCCNYRILKCAAGRRYGTDHDTVDGVELPNNSNGLAPDDTALAYLPHPQHTFYHTWSYKYCEVDPGCCGFRVSSVVQPQQFAYYFVKPDHSNYNLRIATHTINDNIDLYTRRDDDGGGRPDTTNYHLTSVRESVPWAIDEDEYDFACLTSYLKQAVMGGDEVVDAEAEAYHMSLGHYIQNDNEPNCEKWVVGVMGDNRYPQTVGASEYSARFYLEFNFPDFECQDSGMPATDVEGFVDASHKDKCIQNNLRFVRDADILLNSADSPKWVVRLTESKKRSAGQFVKWRDEGGPSYPNAQRSGAVWWHRKVHIWDGFETNFVFQITDPSQCGGEDKICDGADGFAFVVTNDARQEDVDYNSNNNWDCDSKNTCDITDGLIGCPADGLGYANSKKSNTVNYFGEWQECTDGLRKAMAVEFDTFYNVERRDPKQGKQHWWINATEYVSYNDNHLGVFMTTEPKYAHQPWGASQPELKALHSDDENGAHFGSTPSVPTMADFQEHTVKIRYTRGFTTEKQGSGKMTTTDIVSADADRRRLRGNHLTKFKTELRTGFEFGYASRVKANVKVKLNRDITCENPEVDGDFYACRQAPPVATTGFGDDGETVRVIKIIDDDEANLEDTETSGATQEETEVRITYMPAFNPKQDSDMDYNIIKEFPGEIQVFIDDMDRYVFQVAVEDRDISKILDTDGNAYVGFTAGTGSKGFAKVGYDPEEVHETHDILAWNFCNNPGCVPY